MKTPVAAAEEHLLTVRELSDYMQLNERTVLKLVAEGEIPGAQLAGQWRFKRTVIDGWLEERMVGGASSDDAEDVDVSSLPDGGSLPLSDIMDDSCVVYDLRGRDRAHVIEEMAQRAFEKGYVADKPWFVGALVERESIAPTAVEGGVAFLHTRQRNSRRIARPFILMGRSHLGVDFGAADTKPTHILFLLGLKYDRIHLPILGRLAAMLRGGELTTKLRAAPTAQRMSALLLQSDSKILRERLAAKKPPAK
jgi:PTS system nitrogen regulatory IIA component